MNTLQVTGHDGGDQQAWSMPLPSAEVSVSMSVATDPQGNLNGTLSDLDR